METDCADETEHVSLGPDAMTAGIQSPKVID
jgi:hypothetical protein